MAEKVSKTMPQVRESVADLLLPVKDDLITLGALLEGHTGKAGAGDLVPQLDTTLKRAYSAANAARRLLVLARPPKGEDYDPAAALRELGAFVPQRREQPELVIEAVRHVTGDREQMTEAFRIVGENVHLEQGDRLRVEVTGEPPARIVLEITGAGRVADPLIVDGLHTLDWEDFGRLWTANTLGGHVALDRTVVLLYLEGDREDMLPEVNVAEPLAACRSLTRRLTSWRGAIGHYEPGLVDEGEITAIYRDIVDRSMADINRVLAGYRNAGPDG